MKRPATPPVLGQGARISICDLLQALLLDRLPVARVPLIRYALAAYFVIAAIVSAPVQAGVIPGSSLQVDLNAREQEFVVFMDALFQQIGVPLVTAEGIEGTINGRFNGSVSEVLKEVTTAFNVIVYFDGAVAYLYKANQISRKVIASDANTAKRVYRQARQLDLPDARNKISLQADGLLVSGTPRFNEQLAEMFKSVEVKPNTTVTVRANSTPQKPEELPPSAAVYKIYRLKHAWAGDTSFQVGGQSVSIPGVATILQNLVTEVPVLVNRSIGADNSSRGSLDGLRGRGLNLQESNSTANVPVSVQSVGGGETDIIRIVADTRLNAVIVRDTPERIPAYDSLIDSLDVESQMVEIEATIIDINTDMTRELGINWRYSFSEGDVLFGEGSSADQALLPGTDVITQQGRGGVLSFMLGEPANFLGRIRALEEKGAARVVSKPHVITLSDVEAILGASTEFFVRIAGDQEVDLFNVPVGTFLRVTPHVFQDQSGNRIKLLVNIEDGAQAVGQTVDSIPVVERANINTQAVINEGDSLLIGGLVRDSYSKSSYRVPVLGSIPGLGRLFRSDRNNATRVERLFMITPRLANGTGFGAVQDLPTLQGSSDQLVLNANNRMESMRWPERKENAYWPTESAAAREEDTSVDRMRGSVSRLPDPLPQVISPFSVEAWPAAGSIQ